MTENPLSPALETVQTQLDQLIANYQAVLSENARLTLSQEQLRLEKEHLLAQSAAARTRVEAMITRLKALEQAHD